ncbi:MAG: alkaline phosphatase family protein [Peptococcaceae bacterium]|nr:alkaline phosphatase family protein [Peptococcaceae bacterium]
MKNAATEKVLVIGIDGMDPRMTKYYMEKGYMPNLKTLLEKGSAREDLVLLGGMPTITPPMWTTLATGTYPMTHGITDFWRQDPERLDTLNYAIDSRLCRAEQLWNVTAEAGKKTLVLHWPGSSWPPSSNSENLFVIDGTNPEGICMATGEIEEEYIAIANTSVPSITYKTKAGTTQMLCVVTDLDMEETDDGDGPSLAAATGKETHFIRLEPDALEGTTMTTVSLDASLSPIKDAEKWAFDVPADAKEFVILSSKGKTRRPALLLKGDSGDYDTIKIYKSKKDDACLVTMTNHEFVEAVIDEVIKDDVTYTVNRNMRVLDIDPKGESVRIWMSAALNTADDSVFSPKSLHQDIIDNVGYPMPVSNVGFHDKQLAMDCMQENWMRTMRWWADAIHYMIEEKGVEVVFSQIHNDDAQKHNMISVYREDSKFRDLPMEDHEEFMINICKQNDYYIGRFLHLLDEDWTILLVSDHGLVISEMGMSPYLPQIFVDATFMRDWGYTEVKYDADGKPLMEIDWSKTKAIASRMNSIYINLKGRWENGIVDPEDQYDLEAEIISKLYDLRDEKGRAVISLALRNKDAVLLGLGGPECGDIVMFQAEQNLHDHGDSLSTFEGLNHTSVSPIFVAAGRGIKSNYKTTRYIREVDVTPTIATLLGTRMPHECEGAPAYQILTDE